MDLLKMELIIVHLNQKVINFVKIIVFDFVVIKVIVVLAIVILILNYFVVKIKNLMIFMNNMVVVNDDVEHLLVIVFVKIEIILIIIIEHLKNYFKLEDLIIVIIYNDQKVN